jgi:hypothetical protein
MNWRLLAKKREFENSSGNIHSETDAQLPEGWEFITKIQ